MLNPNLNNPRDETNETHSLLSYLGSYFSPLSSLFSFENSDDIVQKPNEVSEPSSVPFEDLPSEYQQEILHSNRGEVYIYAIMKIARAVMQARQEAGASIEHLEGLNQIIPRVYFKWDQKAEWPHINRIAFENARFYEENRIADLRAAAARASAATYTPAAAAAASTVTATSVAHQNIEQPTESSERVIRKSRKAVRFNPMNSKEGERLYKGRKAARAAGMIVLDEHRRKDDEQPLTRFIVREQKAGRKII
jgi:hypothetical protein